MFFLRKHHLLFIVLYLVSFCACKENKRFIRLSNSRTGIDFENYIGTSDSVNPLSIVNIYNGGGVGIGDFNNDGLQDIYFIGNLVPCKLYLNKGGMKFTDITDVAEVGGAGKWARGVAVVDINNDGLLDIYVTNTIYIDSLRRENSLYINQGIDKDGIPHFRDMAAAYGLNLHYQSTMANFFDYDNDGDLDMYITVNAANADNLNRFGKGSRKEGTIDKNFTNNTGRLFRNDWDSTSQHPHFYDVSTEAGISGDGYGHAATTTDLNGDGWKDIYISNDFLSENILYINNHDGTFTNRSKEYFKHTSYNAMGQDIVDINNDGLPDVVELDMNPRDNYRKKMMLGPANYTAVHNFDIYGSQLQYVRNTLQLNQGPAIRENDSIGPPVFSEVAFLSGVSETDWSWTPLVIDMDNDGFRDMLVTNGFPKDITDHDFIAYQQANKGLVSRSELVKRIPEVKLHNYVFKNTNGIQFKDVSESWGFSTPSFSNGAAYADLDNDGDLDVVINNISDNAFVYENTSRQINDSVSNFLQVKLSGDKKNINGIGATVSIYYGKKLQTYENTPYRGYLSSDENFVHFGLGGVTTIDSVVVKWGRGKVQVIKNVKANQLLTVKLADAITSASETAPAFLTANAVFKEVTTSSGVNYKHQDFDYIDFNVQSTLPHKLSEYCPALVAGDVDGNGLDDIVIGGNRTYPAQVFLQQENGLFVRRNLLNNDFQGWIDYKDEGLLLLDVNGDGSLDLYAARGGNKFDAGAGNYQDQLYLNDGKGNFTLSSNTLPTNHTNKLCVRAFDYNKDGKPDLFVSGRVDPGSYPKPVSSFIFRNDSKNNVAKFTDVTQDVAPALKDIGLVCDAIFSDFDNDGRPDLVLAGEWMPVTFLKNTGSKFINATASSGVVDKIGWWNSIAAGDFRHTGRTDYILGNVGLNTLYKASDQYPVYITAKDFNGNGSFIPLTSLFLPDQYGKLKEFPANGRDDIIERMPALKKRFDHYAGFAKATMQEILTADQMKGALRLKANMLQSCYLRNDGNGKFAMIPLPMAAQVSALNGMVVDDFNQDGNLDVLICGNDFGTDVTIGRYDALNGLLLSGDGLGNFKPLSILQSGIYIPGNARALVKLQGASGNYFIASSENQGPLRLFELRSQVKFFRVNNDDLYATITNKDGKIQKEEFYFGTSFLSQSSRFITVTNKMKRAVIYDNKGGKREVDFEKLQ